MRMSDWSSDVCSSDLRLGHRVREVGQLVHIHLSPFPSRSGEGRGHVSYSAAMAVGSESGSLIESRDRKSVVKGKRVSVRVDHGGRRIVKKIKRRLMMQTPKN